MTTTKKNDKFLVFPTGVWENEFSVGKPFCSGAGEKETQTLKVVWEQSSDRSIDGRLVGRSIDRSIERSIDCADHRSALMERCKTVAGA